jgi:hypothetical protein
MLYLPRTRETGPTGIAYNHGLSYPAGKNKSLKWDMTPSPIQKRAPPSKYQ